MKGIKEKEQFGWELTDESCGFVGLLRDGEAPKEQTGETVSILPRKWNCREEQAHLAWLRTAETVQTHRAASRRISFGRSQTILPTKRKPGRDRSEHGLRHP